ncbi:oxygen sensor protein DosP [mine drainage metagenome]|uniref:Oxygen sensor protein DosP n=1 Tax=mine drainage metagenome TaxID=410659 RepID=A0A1J5QBU3_9ZZZZ
MFGQVERRQQSHAAELDPYGGEAARRLAWAARFVKGKLRSFEREFLARLQGPEPEPPLPLLLNELGLGGRPGEGHVELLLRPGLDAARHRERANALGRILAATGVSPRAGIRATSWLLQAFSALNQRIPGRLSQRKLLLDVVSRRLETDVALREEGAESLRLEVDAAVRELFGALPALQRRVELLDTTIAATGRLPFVVCCAAYVRTADGGCELEAESHAHRLWRESRARQQPGAEDATGDEDATGEEQSPANAMTRAWSSGQLELADAAELARLRVSGIRAHAALSVPDVAGRPPLLLTLYGRLPGQFATATMRGCLDNVRLALGRELRRVHDGDTVPAVAADRRALWRQRLFGGGLRMHMQPIVHLNSATCTKVEALARLQLDDGELLAPAQFLPILGHLELDRLFVDGLHQALAALHHWEAQGILLELSYNLPPSTLRNPDCVAWISSALQRHRLAPARLTLELLEHEAYADEDELRRNAAQLHTLGVRLALDDLGSGYSSLLRLRNLPFDLVKIDQSLVRGIAHDNRRSVPLVAGLVELARRLGVEVAIEGLETQILLEFAAYLHADYAQGYAIARPMPASRIPGWTQGWRMPPLSGISPFALHDAAD